MRTKEIKKLKKQIAKYKRLSLRDDLTGIYNHRKLRQDIKRYLEIKKRYGIEFLVMLIDIDNFKRYNDEKGHLEGDKILKKVAKVLRKSVRKYEKVYRLGGGADEFVIILSHTEKSNTGIRRIRKNLAKIGIEVSIGVAKLSENVLEEIDEQMYKEKRSKK